MVKCGSLENGDQRLDFRYRRSGTQGKKRFLIGRFSERKDERLGTDRVETLVNLRRKRDIGTPDVNLAEIPDPFAKTHCHEIGRADQKDQCNEIHAQP